MGGQVEGTAQEVIINKDEKTLTILNAVDRTDDNYGRPSLLEMLFGSLPRSGKKFTLGFSDCSLDHKKYEVTFTPKSSMHITLEPRHDDYRQHAGKELPVTSVIVKLAYHQAVKMHRFCKN